MQWRRDPREIDGRSPGTRFYNVPFPIVLDETGDVTTKLYRVRGILTSVFVSRDGTVTRVHVGALSGEQIDHFVGEILQ